MIILGIYGVCGWSVEDAWIHSAGASLWKDGKHLNTISEERLSRDKHDGNYPMLSIEAVLKRNKLTTEDVDIVVYTHNIHSGHLENKIEKILKSEFCNASVKFVDHHQAHATAAFYTSPFIQASILSLDGAGNSYSCGSYETGLYALGSKINGIVVLHHAKNFPNDSRKEFDLGQVYNNLSRYVYSKIEPEKAKKIENPFIFMETAPGKIMGLAGYGNYKNVNLPELFQIKYDSFYFPIIETNWEINEKELDMYTPEDVASWMQYQFEEYIMKFFKELSKHSLIDKNLCISGGCGLNVLLNSKLLNIFENVHIFPATNDSGLCFGGALSAVIKEERKLEVPENLAYLGFEYSDEEIEEAING
jgi:carbamoyltransferase